MIEFRGGRVSMANKTPKRQPPHERRININVDITLHRIITALALLILAVAAVL
jgi:hypothetical protein